MVSRERPWEDSRVLDAVPGHRRRTWQSSSPQKEKSSASAGAEASSGSRSTWHYKETDALLPEGGLEQYYTLVSRARSMYHNIGLNQLALVFTVQHMMKGFVMNLLKFAELFLFKDYHLPASEIQVYQALIGLPWAIKPVVGLVSDLFPIFGYRKAPYAIAASLLGVAAFLAVGLLPHGSMSVPLLVVCLTFQVLQTTSTDILAQGTFSKKVQEVSSRRLRSDFMAFVWSGQDAGALLAALCSGVVVHMWGPTMAYLVAAVPAFALLVLVMRGCFEEGRMSAEQVAEVRSRFREQWETCVLAAVVLASTLMIVYSAVASSRLWVHFLLASSVVPPVLLAFSVMLSPLMARMNAFNFLFALSKLSIEGAAFYFFTDNSVQYPEGPHISTFFYGTVKGAVEFTFALVGIYSFQYLSRGWTYRRWMVLAALVYALGEIPGVLMFKRINVLIGVPDWLWLLIMTAITSMFEKWMWMPSVVGISYSCPKGMEVTVFALLMGSRNLGVSLSNTLGAMLLRWLHIEPSGHDGEGTEFRNLWLASAWGCVGFPVVALLLSRLLPIAQMDESLVGDAPDAATAGSLLRRWTRRADEPESEPDAEARRL